MIATDNSVSTVPPPTTSSSADARTIMSTGDFWQLLLTQLQTQDPFQPQDTGQMLQQFVTMQSATDMSQLAANVQEMQSVLLIGKTVAATVNGSPASGQVVGYMAGDQPALLVQQNGTIISVPVGNVTSIQADASVTPPATSQA